MRNIYSKMHNCLKYTLFSALWVSLSIAALPLAGQNIVLTFSSVAPKCFAYTDGTVTVNASGGITPYSYHWQNGQSGQTNFGVGAGTYSVTVTDQSGQTAVGSTVVTQPTQVVGVITPVGFSCTTTGGTLNGSVTGGIPPYTYNWTGGSSSPSIQANSVGTYALTVTDANGCSDVKFYFVYAPLSLSMEVENIPCFMFCDGVVRANVTGGVYPYSYQWSTGATTQQIAGLPPGWYAVTVTDAAGCMLSDSAYVYEPPAITIGFTTITPACGGNTGSVTAQAFGGTPPFTYLWNYLNTIGPTLSNVPAGTYFVRVKDANGCQKDSSVVIPAGPGLNVTLSIQKATCQGVDDGTVTAIVNPATGNYSYQWNIPAPNTAFLNGIASGTNVCVTVTDITTGCQGIACGVVGTHTIIGLQVTDTDVNCLGDLTGTATALAYNGTEPYNYVWTYPDSSMVNGAAITGLGAGAYSVIATDNQGCTAIGVADIGVNSTLQAAFQVSAIECLGNFTKVQFTDKSTDVGSTIVSWNWNIVWGSGSVQFSQQNPPAITLPANETGTAQLTVTDAAGCTSFISAPFSVDSLPNVYIDVDSVAFNCDGSPVHINVTGDPSYTYTWSPTTFLTFNPGPQNVIANPPQNQIYTLVATNGSCADTVQVEVIHHTPLTVSAGDDTLQVCSPTALLNATLNATANVQWFVHDSLIGTTATITVPATLMPTLYTIVATDSFNCTATDSVLVIGKVVSFSLNVPNEVFDCNNGPIPINVVGAPAYTYTWSPLTGLTFPMPNSPNVIANPSQTQLYTVIATNGICSDTAQVNVIRVVPIDLVLQTQNIDTCSATTTLNATFNANSGATLTWYNLTTDSIVGTGTSVLVPVTSTPTWYKVVAFAAPGCSEEDSILISGNTVQLALNVPAQVFDCDNGPIAVSATGTPGLTYQWSPALGVSDPTSPNVTLNPAQSQVYTLTGSIGFCSTTVQVSIIRVEPINLLLNADNVTACTATTPLTATVNANANATITWYDAAGNVLGGGLNLTAPVTTTPTLFIAEAKTTLGCIERDSVLVSGDVVALSLAGPTEKFNCENGPIDITVTGTPGLTYLWSTGDTTASITVDPAQSQVYTLVGSSMGCSDTIQVNVIRVEPINLVLNADNVTACTATTPLTATVNANANATITWYDAAGNVLGGGLNLTAPVTTTPTLFIAEAKTTLGCIERDSVLVSGDVVALSLAGPTEKFDCANGPIDITVTGTPGLTYLWSTGDTTASITVDPAQSQVYTLVGSSMGCSDTIQVNVIRVEPINLVLNADNVTACTATTPLTATVNANANATITWYDAAGNVLGGGLNLTAPVTATPTLFIAEAKTARGCIERDTVTVSGDIVELTLEGPPVKFNCENGPIDIVVTGTPGLTYLWSNGEITPNITVNPTQNQIYTLVGSNMGCSDTIQVSIQRVEPINLALNAENVVACTATTTLSATVNAASNATITWYDTAGNILGGGLNLPTPVTSTPTIIIAEAKTPQGCTQRDTVTVNGEVVALTLEGPDEKFDCNNGPIDINVTGTPGLTYLWSPTGETTPNITVNPTQNQTYTLVGTNGTCSDTVQVNVIRIVPIQLTIQDTAVVSCFASQDLKVTFNVATNATITWNTVPPQSGPTVTVPVSYVPTVYTATATDPQYGCVQSVSATVTGHAAEINILASTPTTLCENDTLVVGVTNLHPLDTLTSILWSSQPGMEILNNNQSTVSIIGSAGSYLIIVNVVNKFGCTATEQIPVTFLPAGSLAGQVDIKNCGGLTATFTNQSSFAGTWNFGDQSQPSTETNPSHTYAGEGSYTVTFTPLNAACIAPFDTTITVQMESTVPASIEANLINCTDQAVYELMGQSGTGNYTWNWNVGGQPSTAQNPTFTFTQAGPTTALLTVTDANGCSNTATLPLDVNFINDKIGADTTICKGNAVQLNPDINPNYMYQWSASPNDPSLIDTTSPNPTVTPADSTVYTVVITNGNCTVQYSITVKPRASTILSAGPDQTVCSDDPITLSVINPVGNAYQWSQTPTFNIIIGEGSSVVINPEKNGVYYVRATNSAADCPSQGLVHVNNAEVNVEALPLDRQICFGESTTLSITNLDSDDNLTYNWSPNLSGANPTVTPDSTSAYTVVISNAVNSTVCRDTLTFNVGVTSLAVTAEVTGKDTICPGQTTTLLATAIGTGTVFNYSWTPAGTLTGANTANPTAKPNEQTTYTVTATADGLCPQTASVTIYFMGDQCVEPSIFVPKAFTPNKDGNNDFFIVRGVNITELYMVVWDRWGEKVYETTDIRADGWDGTYQGASLTPDAYAWYVKATCGNGAVYEKKGNVTLLK